MKLRDVNIHKSRLDELTTTILSKSSYTLQKIEDNIRLTHQIRSKTALIQGLDKRVDQLTAKLAQYQYVLTQLNRLLIRSEFFEKQLQMYESQQNLNHMRLLQDIQDDQIWKDDELNWKTSEATLENLWLEFRFLMRKVEADVPVRDYSVALSARRMVTEPLTPKGTPERNLDESVGLKPIRCVSKREKSKRRSLNLNLLRYSPSMASSPLLLTPDSSFDTSNIFSESFQQDPEATMFTAQTAVHKQEDKGTKSPEKLSPTSCQLSTPVSRQRANTEPHSILSLVDWKTNDISTPTKASLRHAVSLEAGLMMKKKRQVSVDEEVVKDSEWLASPAEKVDESIKREAKIMGIYTPGPTPDSSLVEEENAAPFIPKPVKEVADRNLQDLMSDSLRRVPEPIVVEDVEEETLDELPTFSHPLNRSNSCDSIFSAMKSRIPLRPMVDSRTQTMSWMQKFTNTQHVSAKPTNVTTLSINNLSTSRNGASSSKNALSSLVSQSKFEQPKPVSSSFSFWFSGKRTSSASPLSKLPTAVETAQVAAEPSGPSGATDDAGPTQPMPIKANELVPHVYEALLEGNTMQKQWSSGLFSRLNESLMPLNSLVTSEVGKVVGHTTAASNRNGTSQRNRGIQPPIKGSFSTLTIGHDGNKIVQHGERSIAAQSSVVASRVSHVQLQEALKSQFQFD